MRHSLKKTRSSVLRDFFVQVKRDMVSLKCEIDSLQAAKDEIEDLRDCVDRLERQSSRRRRRMRLVEQVATSHAYREQRLFYPSSLRCSTTSILEWLFTLIDSIDYLFSWQGLTCFLVYAIFAAVLGMFQFGFNTGVINAPQRVSHRHSHIAMTNIRPAV